jgi:hypothetical protein
MGGGRRAQTVVFDLGHACPFAVRAVVIEPGTTRALAGDGGDPASSDALTHLVGRVLGHDGQNSKDVAEAVMVEGDQLVTDAGGGYAWGAST